MITLASDFGSPYPAAMRGVCLANADARLVDVAHDLPRGDVGAAAFWLREVLPYFPPAVHLAVVDPGVGTDRSALVVRAGDHALVGPDNGSLLPPARALADVSESGGRDAGVEVFAYDYADPESATFHGRDVFAPAAAAVHEAGVDAVESLPAISPAESFVDHRLPEPTVGDGDADGEVLVVDDFGNAVTNVPGRVLDDAGETIRVNGERAPVGHTYATVAPGERLVTVGSHGNVELAVNDGRGVDAFGVGPGDAVSLAWDA